MKGKSHDEFHKWLQPYLEMAKKLETSKSQRNAQEIIEQLELSFKMYNVCFNSDMRF